MFGNLGSRRARESSPAPQPTPRLANVPPLPVLELVLSPPLPRIRCTLYLVLVRCRTMDLCRLSTVVCTCLTTAEMRVRAAGETAHTAVWFTLLSRLYVDKDSHQTHTRTARQHACVDAYLISNMHTPCIDHRLTILRVYARDAIHPTSMCTAFLSRLFSSTLTT